MNTIDEIGEFGLIEFLEQQNKVFFNDPIKGIGDDCAVIEKDDKSVFLISTELFIEDIHFLKEGTPPYELGIKSVNASLSDIAAMGGTPLYIFTSIGIPKGTELKYVKNLYNGIKNACISHKVDIIGGDTSSSINKIIINITIIGEARKDKVVYRKGAKIEDFIYVTGNLGNSAAGLMLIQGKISAPDHIREILIKAHNMPQAKLEIGRLVAENNLVNAMIDISDGLVADLNHICKASNIGAVIYFNDIPLSQELLSIKKALTKPVHELALYGGEDYELILIVPPDKVEALHKICKTKGLFIHLIGKMVENKGIWLLSNNRFMSLKPKGFTHF